MSKKCDPWHTFGNVCDCKHEKLERQLEETQQQIKKAEHRLKVASEISKLQQEQLEKAEAILKDLHKHLTVYVGSCNGDEVSKIENYFKDKKE